MRARSIEKRLNRPVPAISHLILEDPAHNFGTGDVEERIAYYTRDIDR